MSRALISANNVTVEEGHRVRLWKRVVLFENEVQTNQSFIWPFQRQGFSRDLAQFGPRESAVKGKSAFAVDLHGHLRRPRRNILAMEFTRGLCLFVARRFEFRASTLEPGASSRARSLPRPSR